jgi:hypothetical protein
MLFPAVSGVQYDTVQKARAGWQDQGVIDGLPGIFRPAHLDRQRRENALFRQKNLSFGLVSLWLGDIPSERRITKSRMIERRQLLNADLANVENY